MVDFFDIVFQASIGVLLIPTLLSFYHAMWKISDTEKRMAWFVYFILFNILTMIVYWVRKPYREEV